MSNAGTGNVMFNFNAIAPFVRIENGAPVTCYPVTFDGRKMTVHTSDGPRTRTRRNRGGYATAAMLRAMGYNDLCAAFEGEGDDEKILGFTTARVA